MVSRIALLALLCAVAATVRASQTYSVGGESGWTLGSPIGSVPNLHAGDTLHFAYRPGQHTVAMVSEKDYHACRSSSPSATFYSGNDYINLPNKGTYHFICSIGDHCNSGMKMAVTVK